MIVNKNDPLVRTSIWTANNNKCLYCGEYVFFKDLEIDHIIPEKIPEKELRKLKKNLNIEESFNLNSLENLVPSDKCNRQKSSIVFSEESIRFYREIWLSKIPMVRQQIKN